MTGLLSAENASGLIARGLSDAGRRGEVVAIAVVDAAGHLLAFQRHEGAMFMANDAAIAKARTAAGFRRSTAEMQSSLEAGKTAYLSLPGCLPLAGGVPIVANGQVLGGLGVSGAPSAIDAQIAQFSVSESSALKTPNAAEPAEIAAGKIRDVRE